MKNLFIFISLCLLKPSLAQNLTTNLQACYPMDCSAQNFASTGTPLNGTAVNLNCTVGHNGQPGTAYDFSGLNTSYFVVPGTALTQSTNSLCVSGWYYASPASLSVYDQYLVYSKNNCSINWEAFALYASYSSSGVKFNLEKHASSLCNGFDVIPANALPINTWHHVVFYLDNSSAELYINGILEGSTTHNVPFDYVSGKDIVLGGSNESPYFFPFQGKIDNVRFYNRKLTAQEVTSLYTLDPACSAIPATSFTASKKSICKNQSIVFTDKSSNSPTMWNWQFQGGVPASSSLSNPTVTFPNPGTFTVSLTASNGSGSGSVFTQTIVVGGCVGIDENAVVDDGLFFYPNPTTGHIKCIGIRENEILALKIMDLSGKMVYSKTLNENSTEFEISDLKPAVYIVEIQNSENKTTRKKLIKL